MVCLQNKLNGNDLSNMFHFSCISRFAVLKFLPDLSVCFRNLSLSTIYTSLGQITRVY